MVKGTVWRLLLLLWLPCTALATGEEGAALEQSREALIEDNAVTINTSVSTLTPWVRQQIVVTMEVITPELSAHLLVEPEPLRGFELIPLTSRRERIQTADGERMRLRTGFALFALSPGSYRPTLPPVHYRLYGASRKALKLPPPPLTVKPLPPYVPATMPVGALAFRSRTEPGLWLGREALGFWHLTLEAEGIPADWLPPLQGQLPTTEAIRFRPATLHTEQRTDHSGVTAQTRYRVPFIPQESGRLALPTLRLQYFDPQTGRLEWLTHSPERALVLSLPLRWLLAGVFVLLLGWAARHVWRTLRLRWWQQRERRAAIRALRQANSATAIRQALRHYAYAHNDSANLSITGWYQRYGRRLSPALIAQLQRASYGPERVGPAAITALRVHLIAALRGS
ncbi:MAG: hypothetical protein ACQETD_02410 [Pseudomonadota bacterium]